MKRPKSIILLIVWFAWAAGQDLDTVVRFSIKTDYYIFASHQLSWLFFAFAFLIFILNTSTLYYLFRPNIAGLYTAFAALILAAIQNVMALSLTLSNLPGVREAYERGRELRGLPVRQEAMDMIFTEQAMYAAIVGMLGLYFIVSFLVFRNRPYFAYADE